MAGDGGEHLDRAKRRVGAEPADGATGTAGSRVEQRQGARAHVRPRCQAAAVPSPSNARPIASSLGSSSSMSHRPRTEAGTRAGQPRRPSGLEPGSEAPRTHPLRIGIRRQPSGDRERSAGVVGAVPELRPWTRVPGMLDDASAVGQPGDVPKRRRRPAGHATARSATHPIDQRPVRGPDRGPQQRLRRPGELRRPSLQRAPARRAPDASRRQSRRRRRDRDDQSHARFEQELLGVREACRHHRLARRHGLDRAPRAHLVPRLVRQQDDVDAAHQSSAASPSRGSGHRRRPDRRRRANGPAPSTTRGTPPPCGVEPSGASARRRRRTPPVRASRGRRWRRSRARCPCPGSTAPRSRRSVAVGGRGPDRRSWRPPRADHHDPLGARVVHGEESAVAPLRSARTTAAAAAMQPVQRRGAGAGWARRARCAARPPAGRPRSRPGRQPPRRPPRRTGRTRAAAPPQSTDSSVSSTWCQRAPVTREPVRNHLRGVLHLLRIQHADHAYLPRRLRSRDGGAKVAGEGREPAMRGWVRAHESDTSRPAAASATRPGHRAPSPSIDGRLAQRVASSLVRVCHRVTLPREPPTRQGSFVLRRGGDLGLWARVVAGDVNGRVTPRGEPPGGTMPARCISAAAIAVVTLLAACGDDDTVSGDTTGTAPPRSSVPRSPPPP